MSTQNCNNSGGSSWRWEGWRSQPATGPHKRAIDNAEELGYHILPHELENNTFKPNIDKGHHSGPSLWKIKK